MCDLLCLDPVLTAAGSKSVGELIDVLGIGESNGYYFREQGDRRSRWEYYEDYI